MVDEYIKGEILERFIRVDALLHGVAPPTGAEVTWDPEECELAVYWPRVAHMDNGDEGLTLLFKAFGNLKTSVQNTGHLGDGTMAWFVHANGSNAQSNVHPARDPADPVYVSISKVTVDPREWPSDTLDEVNYQEWLEFAGKRLMPEQQAIKSMGHWEDQILAQDCESMGITEPHLHWSRHDDHYLLYFEDGVLHFGSVTFDEYMPPSEDELFDMVNKDLEEFFDRAGLVSYRYTLGQGWRRATPEQIADGAWATV